MGKVKEFFADSEGNFVTMEQQPIDTVTTPPHYTEHYPFEVRKLIGIALNTFSDGLTPEEIYYLGSEMKYRLRAGFKGDLVEDMSKAMEYYEFRKGNK